MTPPFLAAGLEAPHGFFTRAGGVSTGRFATLNCSLSGRDDPRAVAENRARARAALGVGALVGLFQVHGAAVAVVEEPWGDEARPEADALVTRRRGVALGIVTADCAPVLFLDPAAGVIGAAHAGWRGALAGVLEATVAAMERLGAARGRISAAIGPTIRQPSYEVAADLRDAVLAADPAHARFFVDGARPGRWHFDLPGFCATALARAGIARVIDLGLDTYADPARFFSYRRAIHEAAGPIGHQLAAIALA
ncbi:peptidoglycan editing factor PgeF [Elioraea sp.]|uniref:peptidoglycan editing factor PgeF n=1 Tax=Elioraea sp. TaxID=2185103 RepID=UPI0021DDCF9E|nr:peptidoglycan editing factor PgeF [Elioraea sp.]GIX11270.1 MAG: laccase domain protein [Elioraea sp.]